MSQLALVTQKPQEISDSEKEQLNSEFNFARNQILEIKRHQTHLSLIASVSFFPKTTADSMQAWRTRNAAFGVAEHMDREKELFPGLINEFYNGADGAGQILVKLVKEAQKVFGAKYVAPCVPNGSLAVDLIKGCYPKSRIISLEFPYGHFTHGEHDVNNGRPIDICKVQSDGRIDMQAIRTAAAKAKTDGEKGLLIIGGSAMVRIPDWQKLRAIADENNCILFADFCPIAGFVAAGRVENPMDYAHIGLMTTHKSFWGPRGAMIFTNDKDIATQINSELMPKRMGEKNVDTLAGIYHTLIRSHRDEYHRYADDSLENGRVLADTLLENKHELLTGGTETHQVIIKLDKAIDGKKLTRVLDQALGITTNYMVLAKENGQPSQYGVRLGTQAATSCGMTKEAFICVGTILANFIEEYKDYSAAYANGEKETCHEIANKWKRTKKIIEGITLRYAPPEYVSEQSAIDNFRIDMEAAGISPEHYSAYEQQLKELIKTPLTLSR